MIIEYDPAKSARNSLERGLSFARAHDMDWSTSTTEEDTRRKYPEHRFVTTGYLGDRLHVVCYTPIEGGIRVISFRKANKREQEVYKSRTAYR